jgi:hypothetical protein
MMINAIHSKLPLFLIAVSLFMPAAVRGECAPIYLSDEEYISASNLFFEIVANDIIEANLEAQNEVSPSPVTLHYDLSDHSPEYYNLIQTLCREDPFGMVYNANYTLSANLTLSPEGCTQDDGIAYLNIPGSSLVYSNVPVCYTDACASREEEVYTSVSGLISMVYGSTCEVDSVAISRSDTECAINDDYYTDGMQGIYFNFTDKVRNDLIEAKLGSPSSPFTLDFDMPVYAPDMVEALQMGCQSINGLPLSLNFTLSGDECAPVMDDNVLEIPGSSMVFSNHPLCFTDACATQEEAAYDGALFFASMVFDTCVVDSVAINIPDPEPEEGKAPIFTMLLGALLILIFTGYYHDIFTPTNKNCASSSDLHAIPN